MRILIATGNREIVGGVETYLHVLIPALLKRGHKVAMLYENQLGGGGAAIDPAEAELPLWFGQDLERNPGLWQKVAAWKPEIAYSQGLGSLALEKTILENYPAVVYAHGYPGTCGSGRKCHAFPRIEPCTRRFGPMCLALYYPRRCGGLNPLLAWRIFQTQSSRHARLKDYKAILVASEHMRREFQQHVPEPDKVRMVPLPMTVSAEAAFAPAKIERGRILFVGRLIDLKGAKHLIEAIPRAESKLGFRLSLTVAGDGPERGKLQDMARRLGLTAEFVGWVQAGLKMDLLRQADLLAIPSLWPEPFGLAGIEAGRMSVPAVGYAVGGIPDWLIPGRTGELAPGDPPTVQGLADAIVRALAKPDHYAKLCRGASEAASRYTLEAHLAKLEPILCAAQLASSRVVSYPRIELEQSRSEL
jgi:glycosyltransferase involved in cell wall biosynthesis